MTKNLHERILRGEPKEQHLSIVPKSYPYFYIFTGLVETLSILINEV